MKVDIYSVPDLFVAYSKEVESALRRAVRDALIKHKREGNPIVVWKDGAVQFIKPEDIVIEPVSTEQT